MSQVQEIFRHCPECGRRFHIKLVSKELVGERKDVEEMKQARMSGAGSSGQSIGYVVAEENIPITIDIRDFKYNYKCKHCGHMWTEIREKESKT